MERFRFGEQAGPNGNKITFNGWLSVFEHDPGRLHIETAGPNGGVRSGLIIDKATAGKLGAALLKWAGTATAWRGAWGFDFTPRFEGDFPGNPGGKKEAMAAAIEARVNGEWDHPSLMAVGPLMPDEDADIAEIKRFYED